MRTIPDLAYLGVYANSRGYVRTDIFLSKPQKAASEKIAKKKGTFVAELVRLIIDESTVGRNKKGESLVAGACAGVEEHHASGRARSFCATDTLADSLDTVPRILDSFSLPSQMARSLVGVQTELGWGSDGVPSRKRTAASSVPLAGTVQS